MPQMMLHQESLFITRRCKHMESELLWKTSSSTAVRLLRGIYYGQLHSGYLNCGQINQYSRFSLKKWVPGASDQRWKGPFRLLSPTSPKARLCDDMVLYQYQAALISTSVMAALKTQRVLQKHLLPLRPHLFPGQNHIVYTLLDMAEEDIHTGLDCL